MTTVALLFLLLLSGPGPLPAVLDGRQATGRHAEQHDDSRVIFESIRQGLQSGNVGSLTSLLAPQVQVNLRGGENGYYSADQAHYLLENYLRSRRLVNLKFTTVGESDRNPYATGGAGLFYKGSREYVQVYVALSPAGNRWVISRINIY